MFQEWLKLQDKAVIAAYNLATIAHAGDKRWDGQPYITHIEAVMMHAEDVFNRYKYSWTEKELRIVLCLAAVHDIVEDHPETYTEESVAQYLRKFHIGILKFKANLNALTKRGSYVDYIKRMVDDYRLDFAIIVKLADLKHNLFDLKPGSRKDKYELAQLILETTIDKDHNEYDD